MITRTMTNSTLYINWVARLTKPRLVVAALKALTLLTKGKLKATKSGIKPFLTSFTKRLRA